MVANVVLSFTLFALIGATGIAIATTLSGWINVALLVVRTEAERGVCPRSNPFAAALLGIVARDALHGRRGVRPDATCSIRGSRRRTAS